MGVHGGRTGGHQAKIMPISRKRTPVKIVPGAAIKRHAFCEDAKCTPKTASTSLNFEDKKSTCLSCVAAKQLKDHAKFHRQSNRSQPPQRHSKPSRRKANFVQAELPFKHIVNASKDAHKNLFEFGVRDLVLLVSCCYPLKKHKASFGKAANAAQSISDLLKDRNLFESCGTDRLVQPGGIGFVAEVSFRVLADVT